MESLREELNNEVNKYMGNINKERYKSLVDLSNKLDDVIVKYIKSTTK